MFIAFYLIKIKRGEAMIDIHSKEALEAYVFSEKGLTVLDIWAAWCRPCQVMEPTLKKLEEMYNGRMKFFKLNSEELPELAQSFKVQGFPTFVIYRNGKELGRIIGYHAKDSFIKEIENFMKK